MASKAKPEGVEAWCSGRTGHFDLTIWTSVAFPESWPVAVTSFQTTGGGLYSTVPDLGPLRSPPFARPMAATMDVTIDTVKVPTSSESSGLALMTLVSA